jgi:catechol 2,3-dioxygenase-like lactoylglutathione lyase family enzyme
MPQPTAVLFYVAEPAKSTAFYEDLLGRKPAMKSTCFTLFKLDDGFELALWAVNKEEPAATAHRESSELDLWVPDEAALESTRQQWINKGIPIVSEPRKMDFGGDHFVGLDPDGHRLRVATTG